MDEDEDEDEVATKRYRGRSATIPLPVLLRNTESEVLESSPVSRGRRNIKTEGAIHVPVAAVEATDATAVDPPGVATEGLQQPSAMPFLPQIASPTTSASGRVSLPARFSGALPLPEAYAISRYDAIVVHHYAQELGRWLDGTDPSRQFSLRIPQEVKHCPILLYATLCFSARHLKDEKKVTLAYNRCISLLIERLNLNTATQDDDLLCAIVILRFFEQLNVPIISGSDNESHLAGSAALLRDFPGQYVDPTAPTLREAAFWIYVRQCLYNSTVDQQPPNIDFSLKLRPKPSSLHDSGPLAQLRRETAWANQMVWHCACVVNFCFDDGPEHSRRSERWEGLWHALELWERERPSTFDPLWEGVDPTGSAFPNIYFTADWHVVAYGFLHFSSILLLTYKPGPKFALRNVRGKPSERDNKILEHARAICGSCKSASNVVPSLITLCHSVFIWGPLVSDPAEQAELLGLLTEFERTQTWPTTWITNALKMEWGVEEIVP